MRLKEILEDMIKAGNPVLLSDSKADWEASDLLSNLSEMKLKQNAHHQPGLYIAEINEAGYLGQVLYRIKVK